MEVESYEGTAAAPFDSSGFVHIARQCGPTPDPLTANAEVSKPGQLHIAALTLHPASGTSYCTGRRSGVQRREPISGARTSLDFLVDAPRRPDADGTQNRFRDDFQRVLDQQYSISLENFFSLRIARRLRLLFAEGLHRIQRAAARAAPDRVEFAPDDACR